MKVAGLQKHTEQRKVFLPMPETYRKPVRILRMGREALQEGGVREWRLARRLARSTERMLTRAVRASGAG